MAALTDKDFQVDLVTRADPGHESLIFVAKRTYRLDAEAGACTLDGLDEQPELHGDDIYEDGGDALSAVLLEEGELAPFKQKVDVVVRGRAYAPGGEPLPRFEVGLKVGPLQKTLQVIGPRQLQWQPPKKDTKKAFIPRPPLASEPAPIAELPLTWAEAWGGSAPLLPLLPEEAREELLRAREEARKAKEEAKAQGAPEPGDGPSGDASSGDAPEDRPQGQDEAFSPDRTMALDVSELDEGAEGPASAVAPAPATGPDATQVLRVGETREVQDEGWTRPEDDAAPRPTEDPEEEEARIPCPWNPIGRGFAIGPSDEMLSGLEMPRIEDPRRPIDPAEIPRDPTRLMEPDLLPAGFGWVPRSFWQRARLAGFTPEQMEEAQQAIDEQVVQLDPEDEAQRLALEHMLHAKPRPFDPAYHNGAPPDQQLDQLRGDEEVQLRNMDPSGVTRFTLPGRAPLLTLDRGRGPELVPLRLDTLVIDREQERVTLLWRGGLPVMTLDEVDRYPIFQLDIREAGLDETRAAAAEAESEDGAGATQLLELDGVEEPPSPEPPTTPPPSGQEHDEDLPEHIRGARVIDLKEEARERQVDERWIEDARAAEDPDELEALLKARREKTRELEEKKAALRERLAAMAAEEAGKKGKKKKS